MNPTTRLKLMSSNAVVKLNTRKAMTITRNNEEL